MLVLVGSFILNYFLCYHPRELYYILAYLKNPIRAWLRKEQQIKNQVLRDWENQENLKVIFLIVTFGYLCFNWVSSCFCLLPSVTVVQVFCYCHDVAVYRIGIKPNLS